MAKKYIDADAVIDAIQNRIDELMKSPIFRNKPSVARDLYGIKDYILFIPAADVEEVKRGYWIGLDSDQWNTDDIRCSNCGHDYTVDAERYCDIGFIKADLKYCPNCGAKMMI